MPPSDPAGVWITAQLGRLINYWKRLNKDDPCHTDFPSDKLLVRLRRSKYWNESPLPPELSGKLEQIQMATARRALTNLYLDCKRRRNTHLAALNGGKIDKPNQPTTPHDELEAILTADILKECLERAARHLTNKERDSFVLMELKGLSKEEAAEKLGRTAIAVQRAKNRAMVKLKNALRDCIQYNNETPKGGNNQ